MISEEYDLQLRPGGAVPVIHCSQYDSVGSMYTFILHEGATLFNETGYTAMVSGTKPDKKGFAYSASFGTRTYTSGTASIVTVNLTEQMTCVPGPVRCKIELKKSGGDFYSAPFILMVDPAGLADDVDISSSELAPYLDAAKKNARDAEAWAVGTRDGIAVSSSDVAYQNNSKYHAQQATASATTANSAASTATSNAATATTAASNSANFAKDSEAWAVGQRGGVDVPASDATYQNNSEWYAKQARQLIQGGIPAGTTVAFWTSNGHLWVQQTINNVQQQPVDLGEIANPDYVFDTVEDMNAAIASGTVPDGATCYVREDLVYADITNY